MELWLTEDQRFVHNRPDVVSWEADVLTEDVTVTGNIFANLLHRLQAATATLGSEADRRVPGRQRKELKMNGYQLVANDANLRGRYRKSYEKPEAITPNAVEKYTIDLHAVNHVFRKGHRIMVQVQSTWFPIIDRNPQKFVPNIFNAKEEDFQSAVQKIHRAANAASHIVMSVEK